VGVHLIENDVAQALKEGSPLSMVRQNAGVQHVWVGQHDARTLPSGATRIRSGITVKDHGAEAKVRVANETLGIVLLVAAEGLSGIEIKRCCRRLSRDGV